MEPYGTIKTNEYTKIMQADWGFRFQKNHHVWEWKTYGKPKKDRGFKPELVYTKCWKHFPKFRWKQKNVKMRVEKIPVPFGNQTCCNWEINYGGFDGKSSVNEWIFQHAM